MTRHVPVSEFKDRASELISAAEHGEEIIITRHGKAVAALRGTSSLQSDLEAKKRMALANLERMRDEAAAKGQFATAGEWIAWKNEGRR